MNVLRKVPTQLPVIKGLMVSLPEEAVFRTKNAFGCRGHLRRMSHSSSDLQ